MAVLGVAIWAFALGRNTGNACGRSVSAARKALWLTTVLKRVDPVESPVYHALDLALDSEVIEAARWRGWLMSPGQRKEVDGCLGEVAEYRRAHPRWRPSVAERVMAEAEREGRKVDLLLDATPRTGETARVLRSLNEFVAQQAAKADVVLQEAVERSVAAQGTPTNTTRSLDEHVEQANSVLARVEVTAFGLALQIYLRDTKRLPTAEDGLGALTDGSSPSEALDLVRDVDLDDPWGGPYRYMRKAQGFVVSSAGPDGRLGSGDDVTFEWPSSH